MTEGSETDGGNAIETSQTTITIPITTGQLFGPFSNPLQWLSFKSSGSQCDSNSSVSYDLFASIGIARDTNEQNIEVVYKNGQFYFEALRNIDFNGQNGGSLQTKHELPKLYAWFSDAIKANLPSASSSTLNGGTRFYCPLCNEVFMYPNPVVLHMLCTCPKRVHIETIPAPNGQKRNDESRPTAQPTEQSKTIAKSVTKKRGFDIASLVNEDGSSDSSYNKRMKNRTDADVTNFHAEVTKNSSAFHRPISSGQLPNSNQIPTCLPTSSSIYNSVTSSAFKKFDQKRDLFDNAYDLSAFYQRISSSPEYLLRSATAPNSSSMIPTMSLSASLSSSLSSPLLQSQSRSLMSGSLLPYLPPSLAALTYPTTNWCAKCNASFRMTSDLVYHMRSHHKDVTSVAEHSKKKREDKLKCNICHETFKEKHHLTRHMASHQ